MAYRKPEPAGGAAERAAAGLRAWMEAGRLVPGQRLVAAELALELGVALPALREALERLAGEGLVELMPHRGARIARLDPADLEEVYELREVIEGLAARRAAAHGATPALAAALVEGDAAAARGALHAFIAANHAFHAAIAQAAGRPRLEALRVRLSLPLARLGVARLEDAASMAASAADHHAIAAAIQRHDGAAAEAAMRAHIRRAAGLMGVTPG